MRVKQYNMMNVVEIKQQKNQFDNMDVISCPFFPISLLVENKTLYTSTTYVRREENHPFCPWR